MLKYRLQVYRRLNLTIDGVISAFSFLLSVLIKNYQETGGLILSSSQFEYLWFFFVIIIAWPVLLSINGLYPTNRLRTIRASLFIILKASFQGLLVIFSLIFLFKIFVASRMVMAGFAVFATVLLGVKEVIVIYYLRKQRALGQNLRNVVIAGTSASMKGLVDIIDKHAFLGLNVLGVLVPAHELGLGQIHDKKILGSLEDIEQVLRNNPVDNAIITVDRQNYKAVNDIIYHCEEEGVEIWLTATIFNLKIAKFDIDELFDIPIFVFRSAPVFSWAILFKEICDRFFACLFIVLSLPVILLSAALIKLSSPGPVFFKQVRSGARGKLFTLYKLRTMCRGAEEQRDTLLPLNIMEGPLFKVENDPRIFPAGRYLRKFSIDEVPQFWNVLKGDMSIVGPRPPLPDEVTKYKGWHRRKLSMKPGITGLAQISGRGGLFSFDRWAELDLKYIDNWSLWLDAKIVLKTVFVVLSCRGAK